MIRLCLILASVIGLCDSVFAQTISKPAGLRAKEVVTYNQELSDHSRNNNTPLIVESVVEGKATIYVPPNVNIKPGDQLYTSQPETPARPPFAAPALPPPRSRSPGAEPIRVCINNRGISDPFVKMVVA